MSVKIETEADLQVEPEVGDNWALSERPYHGPEDTVAMFGRIPDEPASLPARGRERGSTFDVTIELHRELPGSPSIDVGEETTRIVSRAESYRDGHDLLCIRLLDGSDQYSWIVSLNAQQIDGHPSWVTSDGTTFGITLTVTLEES